MLRHGAAVATPEATNSSSPQRVAAMLLRGYISLFESHGYMDRMRPKMSPALAAVVARPPLPITWVDSGILYELLQVAGEATSYETIRQCGFENTSQQTGMMVLPMLRTLLRLWGASPATLFKNAGSVITVQVKGTRLEYKPETDHSGVMEIDPGRVVNEFVWAGWEGMFLYAYEVAGVQGEVARTQVLDGGRRGRVALRWTPNPK